MLTRTAPIILALLLSASAFADTIILKTGEKLEGKVVSETDTELTVEVQVTPTIKDEKKVPKANVEKIEKEKLDEVAWQSLKGLKLGQNSLLASQYDQVLRPLRGFVNEYPQSEYAAEANKLITLFTQEKERVDAGEVRLGERWLSKEEVEKERFQINGNLAYQYMRSQRQAGDLIGALNSFEVIVKTYPGAKVYPDAVELARETLATLKATVDRGIVAAKDQQARFEAGLAAAAPAQKAELQAARQRELAPGLAAVEAADKAKTWPVMFPRNEKNLDAISKRIQPAVSRIAAVDVAKYRESVALAEQAEKQLAAKDAAAADSNAQALQLWRDNELAKRLQADVTTLKTAAMAAERAAAATAAAATPKATPQPSTPRPTATLAPEAEPEKEKPFFLTVGGIITILVILGALIAGGMAYNKVRQRANDVLE